mmetsp:Transcript_790/g.1481  ORF Transcript_790/g.1481 Transcript_790/m.1481 type:complete len:895 (-) Transcript_790:353-3037(-)
MDSDQHDLHEEQDVERGIDGGRAKRKQCRPVRLSVRCTVLLAITVAVFFVAAIACPLGFWMMHFGRETLAAFRESYKDASKLVEELAQVKVDALYDDVLDILDTYFRAGILAPLETSQEVMSMTLETMDFVDRHEDRNVLWRVALRQLNTRRELMSPFPAVLDLDNCSELGRPHAIWVAFSSESYVGAMVNCSGSYKWEASGGAANQSTTWNIWRISSSNESLVPVQQLENPSGSPLQRVPYLPSARPWYQAQQRIADMAMSPGGETSMQKKNVMSEIFEFLHVGEKSGRFAVAWTAPIAFCGNYSCFNGVVAAEMTLNVISMQCAEAWNRLNAYARNEFGHPLRNSSIFVVNQVSKQNPWQTGLLLGSSTPSALRPDQLTPADQSPDWLTNITARAILKKANGSWNNSVLESSMESLSLDDSLFRFRLDPDTHEISFCKPDTILEAADWDCLRVGMRSIAVDQYSRWLLVMVLPHASFANSSLIENSMNRMKGAQEAQARRSQVLQMTFTACVIIIPVITLGLSLGLARCIATPLKDLTRIMQELNKLDFSHKTRFFENLLCDHRSCIKEVASLHETFAKLASTVRVFARFVPESVVRAILRGDERAIGLHVERRHVSIMFSDIKDFTSISESLSQMEILTLLTHYLTAMTKVIEAYDGEVTEVLGDGLLAFWNTPDDVEEHAAKACSAALAQVEALRVLNETLACDGLPQLTLRIGIHTGDVLSGNLGSATKMKFGCLGDPVNLASRLEGLCKVYGVGIICSGATFDELGSESSNFVTRKLDLVQVKGRQEATEIFELVGRRRNRVKRDGTKSNSMKELSELSEFAKLYEEALRAYQSAEFGEALDRFKALASQKPNDVACHMLLDRAQRCLEKSPLAAGQPWTGVVSMTEK